MTPGDVVGHEPMGIVQEVGPDVTNLKKGDRVVVPFNVCCGSCWMCERQLYSQCETTQNHEFGTGASFFGYSKLYGQVPGGQAEYLRFPFGNFLPIKVPEGPADERVLFLSDVLPTAWQAVAYADVPKGGTLLVLGLGPIGDMSAGIAMHHGFREMTGGRGADAVVDAVGMEAHGSPAASPAQRMVGFMPKAIAQPMMQRAGVDRMAALYTAIDAVRRGGILSIVGCTAGGPTPCRCSPSSTSSSRSGWAQANVKKWTDDIMPLLDDDMVKVVFKP